jgi:hypothetical protein
MDEKILEKVRKLMAIADHPNTPAPEAEVALSQANKLMARHAIDEATLDMNRTEGEKRQPVKRHIRVAEGYTEFNPMLRSILIQIANANRCRVASTIDEVVAYGADEDARWVETLYTNIYFHFISSINPRWDAAKTYDHNVYLFKVAGYKWKEINAIAMEHGEISREGTRKEHIMRTYAESRGFEIVPGSESPAGPYEYVTAKVPTGYFHKMLAAYRRHAKLIGDESPVTTQSHLAYRTQFAESFQSRLLVRISLMANEAENLRDTIPGAALALSSMKSRIDEKFYEDFPEAHPDAVAASRAERKAQYERDLRERQEMLDAMTPKQRDAFLEKEERAQVRNARYWNKRLHSSNYDESAVARGRDAANTVRLDRNAGPAESGARRDAIGN